MAVDGPPPGPPAGTPNLTSEPSGGRHIGDYSVQRELGRGGMGAVYLAEHDLTHERVAMKELLITAAADPIAVQRFLQEGALEFSGVLGDGDAGGCGRVMQLFSRGRRFPMSSGGLSVDYAQQCADRELAAARAARKGIIRSRHGECRRRDTRRARRSRPISTS